MSRAPLLFVGFLPVLVTACGDPAGSEFKPTSSGSGTVDTRYFPEGNGKPLMEAESCQAIQEALTDAAFRVGCVATVQQCPGMVRSIYGKDCMQYDEATVNACVAFYAKAKTCDEITPEQCVLTAFPTTAPFGCPQN
jgi:hypothetical protein